MAVTVEQQPQPAPECNLCGGAGVISERLDYPRSWLVKQCPNCAGRGRLHFPQIVPDGAAS
jgi:hypothetical protein